MTAREKRNRTIGLLTSAGIHLTLLLLFLFLMAWRAPNPPNPEFGIELNFGLDDSGSGDIQPETPPSNETPVENTEEQSVPEETQEAAREQVIESRQESPVVVKEEKPKPIEPKPVVEEKPKVEPKKEEPRKEEPKPESGIDKNRNTDSRASQGDDKNKAGDKGNPEGSLDAKALYGKQGGGGGGDGLSLQMAGWAWADQPKVPNLPDNEDGRIVFEIECDENGDITGINTLERGLSPQAEKLLKDEIRKNSLIRTSGGQTPERSKGRVVFILKTR